MEAHVRDTLVQKSWDRSAPSSFRPITISMCSCLSKLLEKVICNQLTNFLYTQNKLQPALIIAGKSTLTNLLQFDKYITEEMLPNHP